MRTELETVKAIAEAAESIKKRVPGDVGKYEKIGTELGKLVDEKNKAYGDAFHKTGEILKQLYPDGVKPDQYQDMLAIVRVLDKLFRVATDKQAFGESPWLDIAGYGLLSSTKEDPK